MNFSEMPGWTRRLMSERKFRKAVIRAAKYETMKIMARWDNGNAWAGWENGPGTGHAWRKIPLHGMHSQGHVPVSVSGRTLIHSPRPNEWYDTEFKTDEAAWVSFWDWHDDWDEEYCPHLKAGKRCRKMGGTPCPYRPAAGGNYGLMDCDANEAAQVVP